MLQLTRNVSDEFSPESHMYTRIDFNLSVGWIITHTNTIFNNHHPKYNTHSSFG
jgi:hypothetical protein